MFDTARRQLQLRPPLFSGRRLDLSGTRQKLVLPGREVLNDIPYAPPPPPGIELPGNHITEDMVKEWPQDKFRRSKWKTNLPALRAWAKLEDEHEKNCHHPIPVDDWMEPGFYAFNSVIGIGKTAVTAHKAKMHYSAGWPVFHTGAFKFGNYIKRGELYHFSDALPGRSYIFRDEVHAVFHASTSGSNRENAFSNSSTSMPKDKLIFVGTSASKRLPPCSGRWWSMSATWSTTTSRSFRPSHRRASGPSGLALVSGTGKT